MMNIKHQTSNIKTTLNIKTQNILRFVVGFCLVVCGLLFVVPALAETGSKRGKVAVLK